MKKMKSILAFSLFLNYFTPLVVLASEVDDVPSEEVGLMNENKVEVKVKEKILKSLANQDLIISSNIFLMGEEVTFEWKLPEDIEALSINVILGNGITETEVSLIPEKEVHLFEGSFLLEEGSNYSGDWQISEVEIILNEEESVQVSVSDESNPFSNLDFTVIQPLSISTFGSEQITDTPFSVNDFGIVFHQSASLSNQTIEGDIYIGADAVLTLSNVTVLGNIYVLGALYANEVTSKGTLFTHSIHFEEHPQLINGMAIVLGNNHFGNIKSTNEVITDIPIEFREKPVKSVDGILILTGNTLAIADMYVNGHPVEVLSDGSFSVDDIEIGKATTFDVTWATVFGHTIMKSFEVDPHIMSPSGVIHHAPELNGVTDRIFSVGEEIDLFKDVTASDVEDGDLTEKVEVDDSGLDYMKRGTYFITYRIIDSDGAVIEKQATVTMNDPKVLKFGISNAIKTINKGETYQLETSVTAQDNPDYTIEWDSSDEKVITVDQKGNMVAHAPGEAIITATIGTLNSKIQVTVKAPLQKITLNKKDFSILQGKKEKLVVTYDPIDTTDNKNVIWSSDAPKVVSVDKNGNIQALSEGTAVITAKVGMKTVSTKVTTFVPSVTYSTHVQSIGWQEEVENGKMAGTTGQSKRLEGIKVSLENLPYSGGIEYQTHVQSYGWMSKVNDGTMSGTEGQAKRLEAIRLSLTGEVAKQYDLYYRVHAQSFGWLDWAKNGESAGTEGLAKRLEGIEIILVKKGEKAPENTKRSYVKSKPIINYSTHVQKQGWQKVVSNGVMSGTSGKALRLEGILMNIYDPSLTGGIEYRTHVEKIGWQDWKSDWKMSGTQGKALRLEAIEIRLTEEMAQHYDVYYRVHAQSYGWLGWAKNGESAGTEGLGKRLEGIEVRLVLKSLKTPGSTSNIFIKK